MEPQPDNLTLKILKPVIGNDENVTVEGFVNAGFPSPANDYIEKELNFKELFIRNESSTFFVEVEGNSMINAGIRHGDILVVDKSLDLRNDSIVVCFVDGEFTVKKVNLMDGSFYLIPENPNFKPIRINEGADFRLWGIVTFVIHKFR
jgi:DNA polymerase V